VTTWEDIASIKSKEYVPLGTFWSGDWRVPEDRIYAQTIGRDRLELLRKSTYSTSEVLPKPIELTPPTFTRNSIAYLPNGTQVAANVPRFEQGKFDKAVLVEEGTTNLIGSIGSFETDSNGDGIADGWNAILYGSIPSLVNDSLFGIKAQRIANTTSDTHFARRITKNVSITGGKTYTFSAYAKTDGVTPAYLRIDTNGNTPVSRQSLKTTATTWTKLQVTFTAPADATSVYVRCYNDAPIGAVGWVQFDGTQLEEKPYATSFIDGTRSPETLTIPTAGVLNPQEGTVEFWVKLSHLNPNDYNAFFTSGDVDAPGPRILIMREFEGGDVNKIRVFDGDDSTEVILISVTTLQAGIWYYVAFTWSPSGRKLYVNGVLEASNTRSNNLGFATLAKIGSWMSRGYLNGLIDDLRISNRARTDAEIAAAYNSNTPAVWDEDTTYLLRFDGNLDSAQQTTTLYNLARIILTDAGLTEEEYYIDTELQQFPVPYAYFEPQSHREALRKVAEACLGQVYCDREGIIRIEGPSFLQSQTEPVMTITPSNYFRKDNPVKWSEIANYIEVETQPLRPDVVQEVYRSNEPVPITAGQTKTITVYYNHTPCIEATATLENAVSGVQIIKATYYAWGADITVTSTNTGTFELVINAKPLKVLNKEKAIAKDNASITDNGMLKYTFPANSLVQTREVAQKIANILLAYYKDPRRDVEVEWRGNPALLLGDRIAVIDKNETNEYYVTKQELEFDGALRARLSGRRA